MRLAGSTGAHLPTFHARAADQDHVAYMPDTTRPISGTPAGFFPGPICLALVLMSANPVTTLQQRSRLETAHRLPDPHLTHLCAPFPYRSPRRSLANAAYGGLKPLPAGRLRRANLHLSHSMASRNLPTSHSRSFLRSWHTRYRALCRASARPSVRAPV